MSLPIWMLLGFAVWTLLLLLLTVGIYRWSRILSGKAEIKEFRADVVDGSEWYRQSMRAHANCVENLPVFGAIVFALHASGISSSAANLMAVVVLLARVCQSVTHVAFPQTNRVVFIRFLFFFVQLLCFAGMAIVVVSGSL